MERRFYPNETASYREARNELLDAEEALRAQSERVAELRRGLPVGGELKEDYVFEQLDPGGGVDSVSLSQLFSPGKDSLLVYGFMFGPKMDRPCPMCTSFLDSLNGAAPHISQNMAVAVSARSPIAELAAFGASRGWDDLRLVSSEKNSFQYDYLAEDEEQAQLPMANVFVRRDGKIHHFWGSELFFRPYPTGNTRHVDFMWPLWNVLDLSPEGRRNDWYPSLQYSPLPTETI